LRQATVEELRRVADPLLGEALLRMRRGELRIAPGFDGEYGRIALVDDGERAGKEVTRQMGLFG
jgi:PHP family Zn ribbon phosphoesterase